MDEMEDVEVELEEKEEESSTHDEEAGNDEAGEVGHGGATKKPRGARGGKKKAKVATWKEQQTHISDFLCFKLCSFQSISWNVTRSIDGTSLDIGKPHIHIYVYMYDIKYKHSKLYIYI